MSSLFLKDSDATLPLEEKKWARRSHLTTLLTYPLALLPIPFSWVVPAVGIFPLSIFLGRNKKSYSARQALEALYLQAILSFGYIGFGSAFAEDRVLLVFSYIFMTLLHLGLLGFGLVRITLGKNHNYPFSFLPYIFRSSQTSPDWKDVKDKFSEKKEFQEFKNSMQEFQKTNLSIKENIDNLGDANLRSQTRKLSDSLDALHTSLWEKPENYRLARQFLNYFPKTTKDLLERFQVLDKGMTAGKDDVSSDRTKRLENLTELLEDIFITSEDVRRRIYSSESMSLDAEIDAMKKNIGYGGY